MLLFFTSRGQHRLHGLVHHWPFKFILGPNWIKISSFRGPNFVYFRQRPAALEKRQKNSVLTKRQLKSWKAPKSNPYFQYCWKSWKQSYRALTAQNDKKAPVLQSNLNEIQLVLIQVSEQDTHLKQKHEYHARVCDTLNSSSVEVSF